jgi:general secretion pathway protein I
MSAPSAPKPANGEAGFSLIEAVVAAAILALALAAFFGAGRNALQIAYGASRHTEAALEARSLLDRLGADLPLADGEYSGRTESGRFYRITTERIPANAGLELYDVTAELRDRASDRAPIIRLETLKTQEPAS